MEDEWGGWSKSLVLLFVSFEVAGMFFCLGFSWFREVLGMFLVI